jgi:endonuclease YncB( thermonuclease family)
MRTLTLIAVAIILVLFGGARAALAAPPAGKAERPAVPTELATFASPELTLGEFRLASKNAIVDGDTIHVQGLDSSLRLLGIDTEETFKHDAERRAYEAGWAEYLRDGRGGSPRPVKMATPLGEDAKKFAQRFFAGVTTVRLERDHPREVRDYYNRYLAYVIVTRAGKEQNYAVECVRAGFAPYFTKYGYSRRFHDQFVAAEAQARAAHRGIWDPSGRHNPDYEERKVWWDARARVIQKFEREAAGKDNYLELTQIDVPERLEKLVGKEVVVLGAIGAIKLGDRRPTLVMLSRRRSDDFPIVFFDKNVFASSHVADHVGEYVRVYEDKARGRVQLQIKIDEPSQIGLP